MSNDYFSFKQFTVRQQQCAMKVGTDGCLLGAWAQPTANTQHTNPITILDIGTGTGLIGLMMAQRFPEAQITAVDIDSDAVMQAQENVAASPFSRRITVVEQDITQQLSDIDNSQLLIANHYDIIVSNPPYFIDALTSPDAQRTLARHAGTLTYDVLMQRSAALLNNDGGVSVIIPSECRQRMEQAASLAGLMLSRCCGVKTTERKPARRYLLEFRKQTVSVVDNTEIVIGSPEYQALLQDFYLKI